MLPKHNLFIRSLYGVLTLLMFAFMILLVRHYDQFGDSSSITQVQPMFAQSTVVSDEIVSLESFYISGKQYQLDLDTDTEKQLNKFWQSFAAQDPSSYLNTIRDTDKVYLAFGRYDETAMKVALVMGYATTKKEVVGAGYDTLLVPKGQYKVVDSVLTQWESADNSQSYQGDHEVYQLDNDYRVINKQAYVGLVE